MASSPLAWAASQPDAGSILREQPKSATGETKPSLKIIKPAPDGEKAKEDGEAVLLLRGIRITGSELIPVSELEEQVRSAFGRQVTFRELETLALQLTLYFIDKGYLVRVEIPEQEVREGIVTFHVVEGKRGALDVEVKGDRVQASDVSGFVDSRVPQGGLMQIEQLGEGARVLNSQPGVKQAKMSFKKGAGKGDTDIVLIVEEKPLLDYGAGFNNHGSRSTGEVQAFGGLSINNGLRALDETSLLVNASEGAKFIRVGYRTSMGESGLVLDVNAAYLDYEVVQKGLKSLDLEGEATTLGVTASYPLFNRSDQSLALTAGADYKALKDYSAGSETGDKEIRAFNIGLVGNYRDQVLLGGETNYNVSLVLGDADLSGNAGALTTDQAGRKTDGGYGVLKFSAVRNMPFSFFSSLDVSLDGQLASDNLDSSEQFSLGGPQGVRGYTSSDGSGDDGLRASITYNQMLSAKLTVSPFFDAGVVRVNRHTYSGWASGDAKAKNSYALYSAGVSADWALFDRVSANMTMAAPLGPNYGADANGDDGDSRQRRLRFWFGLKADF